MLVPKTKTRTKREEVLADFSCFESPVNVTEVKDNLYIIVFATFEDCDKARSAIAADAKARYTIVS